MHPGVVATLTRWTLVRRVRADGGLTKGGREVLVVLRDGSAEIRDADEDGPAIKRGTIDMKTVTRLTTIVAGPDWKSLPAERGVGTPDGPVAEIGANGHHVKRFDNAGYEPVFREARTVLNAIWDMVDP